MFKIDLDLHDGAIVSYHRRGTLLDVVVTEYNGTLRKLAFDDVRAVYDLDAVEGYDAVLPEGSLDYVAEVPCGSLMSSYRDLIVMQGGKADFAADVRQFEFVSTDGRNMLLVVARSVAVSDYEAS